MSALAAFAKLQPVVARPWLASVQQTGQAVWRNSIWPERKTEHWRYTSLRALEQGEYLAQVGSLDGVAWESLEQHCVIAGLNGPRIVFVNGCYAEGLSRLPAFAGGVLVPFSQANDAERAIINAHLGTAIDTEKHLFAALNSQLLSEGALLHLGKHTVCDQPIHVVNLTCAGERQFNAQPRLLVVADESAQATVVEHFVTTDETQTAFVNNVTELHLGANVQLDHYRLQQEHDSILHIGAVHAKLSRAARLNSFYLAAGAELKRLDVVVDYFGEGGESVVNGVYLPIKNQHIDFHTCIEHRVARCTSSETFRGIIGDSARAVFNGRIHIHPNAQKTLAQLSNKNLLTSAKAEVNTKPELEIYADDVQCAHGATVAQLDRTALHFLRTRGISAREAEVMLSFGFINELINTVRLAAIADYLRPQLAHHFARDPELLRHLL